MTRPFLIVLAALGVGAGAWSGLAHAQHGPGDPGGPHIAAVQREAGLTDAQVGQLRKLMQDERKIAIRRRADLQIARMELEEQLDAPTVDEKVVAAKTKAVADLQAAGVKARVDHRLAVRKVVSADQFAKMRALMRPHRREQFREFRGHGRGPRGPRFGRPASPPDGPRPDDRDEEEAH